MSHGSLHQQAMPSIFIDHTFRSMALYHKKNSLRVKKERKTGSNPAEMHVTWFTASTGNVM
jgi:hypothetical protein